MTTWPPGALPERQASSDSSLAQVRGEDELLQIAADEHGDGVIAEPAVKVLGGRERLRVAVDELIDSPASASSFSAPTAATSVTSTAAASIGAGRSTHQPAIRASRFLTGGRLRRDAVETAPLAGGSRLGSARMAVRGRGKQRARHAVIGLVAAVMLTAAPAAGHSPKPMGRQSRWRPPATHPSA